MMGEILRVLGWLLAAIVGLAIAYVLLLAISALAVDPNRTYEKDSRYYRFLLYSATFLCVHLLGIRLHCRDLDRVPKSGRILLVGNHRSNFDPILTWYCLRGSELAFVSKKENFSIPIFGRFIHRCGFLAIDRENPRNALQTIEQAAGLIQADRNSVAIYPEGTRSKSGELLPFHNGVFKIAKLADVPIVVLAMEGTEKIHKNYLRRPTDVWIRVTDVLSREDVAASRTCQIGQRVRTSLEQALEERENVNV